MGKSNENCGPDTCIVSLDGVFLKLNQLIRASCADPEEEGDRGIRTHSEKSPKI